MINLHMFALLTLLSAAMVTSAQGANCVGKPIPVRIRADGQIFWDGKFTSLAGLDQKFAQMAARTPMPNVRIMPDKKAKYDLVALVLARAQRHGFSCFGFVGIESSR